MDMIRQMATRFRILFTRVRRAYISFEPRASGCGVEQLLRDDERTHDLDQYTANFAAEPVPVQFGEIAELGAVVGDGLLAVQILRPGTFTEMHGKKVTLTEDDLDDYAENFSAGAAGQRVPVFVGHPDAKERAASPAAAWYEGVYTKVVKGVRTLWADLDLTHMGRDMLDKGLYRYISPTLDMTNKVIRGGGFVNLPAIKNQPAMLAQFLVPVDDGGDGSIVGRMGAVLSALKTLSDYLGPESGDERNLMNRLIETLQSLGWMANTQAEANGIFSEHAEDTMELTEAQIEELKATERTKVLAELTEKQGEMDDFAEGIRKEAREEAWAQFTEQQKIKTEVAEFSARITGGDSGLSVEADVVTAFLIGLTPEQREQAKKLLDVKVADFSERGHEGNGGTDLKELPAPVAAALKMDLQRSPTNPGKTVTTFFSANAAQLGPMADYNLSEYILAE